MPERRPRADRAQQFMPFAALKGYYDLIRERERVAEPKRELTDEQALELSRKLSQLKRREMGRAQDDAVFVFDEPTIGLHPLDVRTLLGVFERLVEQGATVVVIEHDLDVIANADYVVDLGPGGGASGGRIVAVGTPEQVADNPESVTGRYL